MYVCVCVFVCVYVLYIFIFCFKLWKLYICAGDNQVHYVADYGITVLY